MIDNQSASRQKGITAASATTYLRKSNLEAYENSSVYAEDDTRTCRGEENDGCNIWRPEESRVCHRLNGRQGHVGRNHGLMSVSKTCSEKRLLLIIKSYCLDSNRKHACQEKAESTGRQQALDRFSLLNIAETFRAAFRSIIMSIQY